jgi:phosphoglycerol transferase MdoB-like AlkP superfamily enzyme
MGLAIAMGLLAVPVLGVHAWIAATFSSYLHGQFGQDLVFAFAWCGLLTLTARWRLLGLLSVPLALLVYLVWLFMVLGEGVSYYLQADTFNARFFAHLDLANLATGLHAFPVMIGGGLALFAFMLVLGGWLLFDATRTGRETSSAMPTGARVATVVILMLAVLGLDSAPRRLIGYLYEVHEAAHFADTAQGRAVRALLDLHPTSPKRLVAAPGKNLVYIYLESLERIFWDPGVFPGLTPNLDRLRKQGLDFSGFEQIYGATYTIAGMFASQCGVPLFPSPFPGLDKITGNDTDVASFHPKIACLGDVLHKAGYTQMYMGGAPISFSHKGLFYRLHGYDHALGLQQLEAEYGGKLPEAGWGLYDSALFALILKRYRELEAAGKPFNLTMITLDTHPPDGRPSPDCPKYAANPNSMLQAVHCTDYEVGKFVDELSREPDWKNTVVVIMSDHLMMRNDAESLFPKGYHRQPSLLVLNAGQGVRRMQMYHMDIAPTLLDLMGVHTNATFIAGQDRSAPNAKGSELVENPVTEAVLRNALWSRSNEFHLCKRDTLIGWTTDGGFDIGGRELKMSYRGKPAVGIRASQTLDFFIDSANAKLVIVDAGEQKHLLATRGDTSVLTIRPIQDEHGEFSVDWLGRHDGWSHLAKIPRLAGLTITSLHCGDLIERADSLPSGRRSDLSHDFSVVTAPLPKVPESEEGLKFDKPEAVAFESGLGWSRTSKWGSFSRGSMAGLGFRMPSDMCRTGAMLTMKVDPYLPSSRRQLDTLVWINGKLATTWYFKASNKSGSAGDKHEILTVTAPISANLPNCKARVRLRFLRPGPHLASYPEGEDPRQLQLRVLDLRVVDRP